MINFQHYVSLFYYEQQKKPSENNCHEK